MPRVESRDRHADGDLKMAILHSARRTEEGVLSGMVELQDDQPKCCEIQEFFSEL